MHKITSILIVLLLFSIVPASAQLSGPPNYKLTPGIHGDIQAGWFITSDIYRYVADINFNFNYGSWGNIHFNFDGGILTLIKSSNQEGFQPDRYRGTLEPSMFYKHNHNIYSFAIKHQSFHTIDRAPDDDGEDMSYELYSLAYQYQARANYTFSAGRYLNESVSDYEWDLYLDVNNAYIGFGRFAPIYYDVTGHYVTEPGNSERGSFFDYNLEFGYQSRQGARYFLAYRQIHDINQFNGVTDHELDLGIGLIW